MHNRDPFAHSPETVTTGQLFIALQSVSAKLSVQTAELARLRVSLDQQKAETHDLVAAWRAGGALLSFIKLVGSIAIAVAATWALVRGLWGGE